MERIGPILVLEGPNYSKVPYSRSLYLDGSEKVLFDSGAEAKTLMELKRERGIELIINTHYHPDHTTHNHLFPEVTKWINPIEFETSRTVDGVARANAIHQELGPKGVIKWKDSLPKELIENLNQISGTYDYEIEYRFGDVKVIFLHTPGHTSGFTCPYFPEQGIAFVGDYDMTSFGPWYNGTDGDIDDFLSSGKRLLTLDADTYITGHQKGIFNKQEFKTAMEQFLSIIDRRDEIIDQYVRQGLTFDELTEIGIFYPKKNLKNPLFKIWERSGIRKHLERLGYTIGQASTELVKSK
ncbi:MBL fold metallo-hydrolase [Neobacillus mesonae]|uniref:MBL fold metallo-hydrolase n=1 Tax=Neobacillus mesonae TaxID=1193713 RepID=UPI0025748703|nr:MBL fold metallo-hydrolase [Neobacillus mesonae]